MKSFLAAAAVLAALAGPTTGSAPAATPAPHEPPPAASSVFTDLSAFGYDLGRFRPTYTGRFPYR